MSGFANPIINALGRLIVKAIQSANFVPGTSGWSINKDGSAEFNELILTISASGVALLIYSGPPANGNLIGSWASVAGTDNFQNDYPIGLNASQGLLTGVLLSQPNIVGAVITNALLSAPQITSANMTGGTITETTITFDSTGGQMLAYTSTTTTVTSFASGSFTVPNGVNIVKVLAIGAGSGGGGGNTSTGGEGGGAGECAEEISLAVNPGDILPVSIGTGGSGGSTGFAGADGGDTRFNDTTVVAHGGKAGSAGVGGLGASGSTNSIHHNGGNGGTGNLGIAGAGGGGSAGTSSNGGGGGNGGSVAGNGGVAGTGGGASGGTGGASGANGVNGNTPGAAGGGAGKGSTITTVTETFYPASTRSYYSDTGLRDTNGTMYHGAYSGAPDYQFAYIQWGTGSLGNSLSSVLTNNTIQKVALRVTNQHSWYNSGMTFGLHYSDTLGGGVGVYSALLDSLFISEGNTYEFVLSSADWTPFKTANRYMVLGPSAANEFNLNWYGYFYGNGPDNNQRPRLTVTYSTGSVGSFNGGNGANGSLAVTYTNASVLAFALSPIAGSDVNSNAFAAGYTGTVQNFHPGSSPSVVETWQNLTLPSGLTGLVRVKKVAESGYVMVDCQVSWTATTATTYNLPSLPYAINTTQSRIFTIKGNSTETAAGNSARLFIGSNGSSVQIIVPASTGGGTGTACVIIPTD